MRTKLQQELSKAQAKEAEKAQTTTSAASQAGPSFQTSFTQGQPQRIIIELRSGSARAEVQADEANAAAFINLLKQQGLRS